MWKLDIGPGYLYSYRNVYLRSWKITSNKSTVLILKHLDGSNAHVSQPTTSCSLLEEESGFFHFREIQDAFLGQVGEGEIWIPHLKGFL